MTEPRVIKYVVQNQFELNLSFMPFIMDGGIFVPCQDEFALGDQVLLELSLPGQGDAQTTECRVVWITPKNALRHADQGIGLQFTGENAKSLKELIEISLDTSFEVGGYTYGFSSEQEK